MQNFFALETDKQFIISNYSNKEPYKAIAELVWNSLDAWANNISIDFNLSWTILESISISDNGMGINFENIESEFGRLGLSNKKLKEKNDDGRFFHWKKWEGRLYSLAIWNSIIWESNYKDDQNIYKSFSIILDWTNSQTWFKKTEPSISTNNTTWVRIYITQITEHFIKNVWDANNELFDKLQLEFAHYLLTYKTHNINIIINGRKIDPAHWLLWSKKTSFKNYDEDQKKEYLTSMDIYHWNNKWIHNRYICWKGWTILYQDGETWFQQKDFWHSIHLSWDYFDELESKNQLLLQLNSKFIKEIFTSAKWALSNYYIDYKKEISWNTIQKLKEEIIKYKMEMNSNSNEN